MSDSPVTDMSVEAWAADAEAIIEAVGPPLPVYASSLEGPIALLLVYQRPDLVSHLILSSTGADGQELAQIPTNQAMVGLQDLDWDLFLNCVLRVILRLEHDVADDALAVLHEEVQPAVMRETRRSHANTDVSDLVPDLEVPALVLDRRDNRVSDGLGRRRSGAVTPDPGCTVGADERSGRDGSTHP